MGVGRAATIVGMAGHWSGGPRQPNQRPSIDMEAALGRRPIDARRCVGVDRQGSRAKQSERYLDRDLEDDTTPLASAFFWAGCMHA